MIDYIQYLGFNLQYDQIEVNDLIDKTKCETGLHLERRHDLNNTFLKN